MLLNRIVIAFILSVISFSAFTQNLQGIGKQKPFTISGSIGASANFYNSNEPVASRPPYGWNIYGNFTPTVYGIADFLPLCFFHIKRNL